MTRDVVIVGGGIVGTSVAYHCVRQGLDTLLVDRDDEGRATDAGAGIVSPATGTRMKSDRWRQFAIEAADYYPDLADQLREAGVDDIGYDRPGILAVAADPAEVDALETALERIRARQERLGVPEPGTVDELSPGEARDRFPALGEVERAFAYEAAGRVDGTTFTDALLSAAREHGLSVARERVTSLVVEGGSVVGVRTGEGRRDADAVVVAGGAWSSAFADDLGVALPVEPKRGQIAHLADCGETDEWPLVKGFRGHYLVPWPGGGMAAGATREEGSGFDPRTTAAGVREVLDEAVRVAPGLADATVSDLRVGLRPASPDGFPLLGPVPGVDGAHVATGHGPTGLTLGPFSGKVVAAMVAGDDPGVALDAFDPGRF